MVTTPVAWSEHAACGEVVQTHDLILSLHGNEIHSPATSSQWQRLLNKTHTRGRVRSKSSCCVWGAGSTRTDVVARTPTHHTALKHEQPRTTWRPRTHTHAPHGVGDHGGEEEREATRETLETREVAARRSRQHRHPQVVVRHLLPGAARGKIFFSLLFIPCVDLFESKYSYRCVLMHVAKWDFALQGNKFVDIRP